MKIIVESALYQNEIIQLLNQTNKIKLEFKKKASNNPLRLEFELIDACGYDAVSITKALIKETQFGKALYFRVLEDK